MIENQREQNVVLVVDDTPESLSFLTDTIDRDGMIVLVANDGSSALDLLQHVMPDLILMDAVMPIMDGFETTRRLKRDPRLSHLPVIFMTGLTETEHVVEALDAGGVDYVRKPIVVEELLARIRVHLGNARVRYDSQFALDASGRHLMALESNGTVLWCTPGTDDILSSLSPNWHSPGRALPEEIGQPLRRLFVPDVEAGASVRMDINGANVEFALVKHNRVDECLIRMTVARESDAVRKLQERLRLTFREGEVLLWISRGKANREISEILGISPRTVNKHLEQIFEKIGVENRASAAGFAVKILAG